MVPFVNCPLEWGAVIATFLTALSHVPYNCARLTPFPHPKWREITAAPITPKLIPLPLRRLRGRRTPSPFGHPRTPAHTRPRHTPAPQALNIGDAREFLGSMLDPPSKAAVNAAIRVLTEVRACAPRRVVFLRCPPPGHRV